MNDNQKIDQWIRSKAAPPPLPEPNPLPEPRTDVTDVRGLTSGAASPDDQPPNPDTWIRRHAHRG